MNVAAPLHYVRTNPWLLASGSALQASAATLWLVDAPVFSPLLLFGLGAGLLLWWGLRIWRLRQGLRLLQQQLTVATQSTGQSFFQLDVAAKLLYFDERAAARLHILGNQGSPVGFPLLTLYHPDDQLIADQALARMLTGQATRLDFEARARRDDGTYFWVRVTAQPAAYDLQGNVSRVVGTFLDIDSAKRLAQDLELARTMDDLTGLARPVILDQALSRWLRGHSPELKGALLCLRLERSDLVVATYGEVAARGLWREVAERTRALAGPTALLASTGTGEFLWLTEDLGTAQLGDLANRWLATLTAPVQSISPSLQCRGYIGIALFPEDGLTWDELAAAARTAVEHAQQREPQTYRFYAPAMRVRSAASLAFETGLRQAVERQELRLAYQPMVELKTGRLVGFEALLRWRDINGQNVPPGRLLPVAERCGLMPTLGQWVLHRALADWQQWPDALQRGLLVLNISALQLHRPEFAGQVRQLLADHGVGRPVPRLEFELTEPALGREWSSARPMLDELLRLGVRLTLDNFGSGYVCLAELPYVPVQRLKLARSLVHAAPGHAPSRAVLHSIVQLSRELRLQTAAEGVETSEQLKVLTEAGCDVAQGYQFAGPLEVAEVAPWARRWQDKRG